MLHEEDSQQGMQAAEQRGKRGEEKKMTEEQVLVEILRRLEWMETGVVVICVVMVGALVCVVIELLRR